MNVLASLREEVSINYDHIYIPRGFDSNDNSEIVITGRLPSTCYLKPKGEVNIKDNKITVKAMATEVYGDDVSCIQAVVPYMITVSLGQLKQGFYEIIINGHDSLSQSIFIEEANSNGINNFPYANVQYVSKTSSPGMVRIYGVHPSSCMEIDDVKIIVNEQADTISVMPIIKQTQEVCDTSTKPFVHMVKLPSSIRKRSLLHVRKIDGTAINYLFTGR